MKFIFTLLCVTLSFKSMARDLSWLNSPNKKNIQVVVGEKKFNEFKDKVFKDGHGREVYFRGWNISNELKSPPYHPNLLPVELDDQIKILRESTGSNIVRYLILWAGVHPQVDVIDYLYLKRTVEVIKNFAARKIYILLDWHQDLFAMGDDGNWHAGDGPPEWIVKGMHLPSGSCGLICLSWSQNYMTNRAVKTALRHFWNNEKVDTIQGKRTPQEEFVWQMKIVLRYLKVHLTAKEFSYIIGIDPWNEPVEGGLRNYNPPLSTAEWHEQKLWPFYRKIKAMIDENGLGYLPIFAEPATFWNINLPLVRPRGEGFLKNIPKEGFVFNSHLYDETREAFGSLAQPVQNGAYLKELDRIRNEGRYLGMPPFVSEYGSWGDQKAFDAGRMTKATYQAMEYTLTDRKKKNRYIDFYAPLISGTQWSWGVGNRVRQDIGPEHFHIERGYPRAVSGDIISFTYKDMAISSYNKELLNWEVIRSKGKLYFENNKFLWLVWRGNSSSAPTEVFIPRHFNLENTLVMTEKKLIFNLKDKFTAPTDEPNEIFHKKDVPDSLLGGTRLFVYNDDHSRESEKNYHFLLVVELESGTSPDFSDLSHLQDLLYHRIRLEKSPIWLTGRIKIDKPKPGNPDKK